jgi:hypothetical protein
MFIILDPVRTREVEKMTDWELFQSLTPELISRFTLLMKLIKKHIVLQSL